MSAIISKENKKFCVIAYGTDKENNFWYTDDKMEANEIFDLSTKRLGSYNRVAVCEWDGFNYNKVNEVYAMTKFKR